MTVLKRVLAVLGLISMAVFVVSIIAQAVSPDLRGRPELILIPLSSFFMFGLLSLAINWLMKLREEKLKEREAARAAAEKQEKPQAESQENRQ